MSKSSVTLLKGLGILLIITHNYMHWLPECVDENEYTFATERFNQLLLYMENGYPHVLFNILSHFGHYGVAIFLFVSGYGLTRKYEQAGQLSEMSAPDESRLPIFSFLLRHAVKLWKLMIPALAAFVLIELYLGYWNRPWPSLLPLLGFYSNLQPTRDLILGPWWWFGLMMQFYVIWRLLIFRRGKIVLYGLTGACLAAQIVIAWMERGNLASTDTLTCYMHYNFPCSMLAFGLGVAYARYNLQWLCQWWSPLVGMALVFIGQTNAGIWCVGNVGAVMIALAFVQKNEEPHVKPQIYYINLRNILMFLGSVSAWLFAIHPIVRAYTIKLAASNNDWDVYVSVALYLGVSIGTAWAMSVLSHKKTYL